MHGRARSRARRGAAVLPGFRIYPPPTARQTPLAARVHADHRVDPSTRRSDDPVLRGVPPAMCQTSAVRTLARRPPCVGARSPIEVRQGPVSLFRGGLREAGSRSRALSESLLPCNRLLTHSLHSSAASSPRRGRSVARVSRLSSHSPLVWGPKVPGSNPGSPTGKSAGQGGVHGCDRTLTSA